MSPRIIIVITINTDRNGKIEPDAFISAPRRRHLILYFSQLYQSVYLVLPTICHCYKIPFASN